jgi:hypothetical protein
MRLFNIRRATWHTRQLGNGTKAFQSWWRADHLDQTRRWRAGLARRRRESLAAHQGRRYIHGGLTLRSFRCRLAFDLLACGAILGVLVLRRLAGVLLIVGKVAEATVLAFRATALREEVTASGTARRRATRSLSTGGLRTSILA